MQSENRPTCSISNTGDDTIEVIEDESKGEHNRSNDEGGKGGNGVVEKPFCPSERHCRNIPTDSYVAKWFNVLHPNGEPKVPPQREWFTGQFEFV